MTNYPKRLIEVDLPIKRISAHARREKSIRHGHISTLHIWWARRPLAACRAVICAALWPDPADENCPQKFREDAFRIMAEFRDRVVNGKLSEDQRTAREKIDQIHIPTKASDYVGLRRALLDFIAEFANYDLSTNHFYLTASRALTQSAHEALGGAPGTRPLVVDPFAGGGSIPLEALRVGADAFASDLNPVAVLLNTIVLEYIPKYGKKLADEVLQWGQWVRDKTEAELRDFYPKDSNGATPIAYLWARTIRCEGPGCGAEVPLIRSLWLAKKGKENSVALRIIANRDTKQIDVQIIDKAKPSDVKAGTVARGSVSCPCCGYTTALDSVRSQFKLRQGGTWDARMLAVRQDDPRTGERAYRLPTRMQIAASSQALAALNKLISDPSEASNVVPDESTECYHTFVNRGPIYGMTKWRDYYTPRQLLALTTFSKQVILAGKQIATNDDRALAVAVQTCLSLNISRLADFCSSLCVLNSTGGRGVVHTFGRQALPMVWDFMETNPFNQVAANWMAGIESLEANIAGEAITTPGHVERATATQHPLPNDAAHALVTDPPYYYSVQYADLSDFFYVWLKRVLGDIHPDHFRSPLTPKDEEIIVQSPGHQYAPVGKNKAYYESKMKEALTEARRVLAPSGIGTVVFAHSSTGGWEAMLEAMIGAGWTITGSWPLDTEREGRLIGLGKAVLASSVHIVCRPRENSDGSLQVEQIGDWREVLAELPRRIHDWMPRLSKEGVVGADAIFACLGPALEIFSRYARVEKASGEQVSLRDYLEQVWAAVSQEALRLVFEKADATGFEEDARLTAMWLWTLNTGNGKGTAETSDDDSDESDDDEGITKKKKTNGAFALEYDAARKIAQGLGVMNMDRMTELVEIDGDTARLLAVSERTKALFGKDQADAPTGKRKKKDKQMKLAFAEELEQAESEGGWGEKGAPKVGTTTLDRVHQSMILFAAGRSEAMKRFLVEEGVGRDGRFWTLADCLSKLYPPKSDEKRWVDGLLARKKGLGF